MLKIGIQGIKGSANEVACKKFAAQEGIDEYEIKYLISTQNVLRELQQSNIDLGTFAYKSSRGGLVKETQEALRKYSCEKITELDLPIEHALLGIRKMPLSQYQQIISHPQALLEHQDFLNKKFAQCQLVEAEDTALAALELSEGKYREDALVIALKHCGAIYNLKIIEANLPANQGYVTNFWLVQAGSKR